MTLSINVSTSTSATAKSILSKLDKVSKKHVISVQSLNRWPSQVASCGSRHKAVLEMPKKWVTRATGDKREGSGEVRMRGSLKSSLAPLTNNLAIISFWSQNLENQNRLKFTCERGGPRLQLRYSTRHRTRKPPTVLGNRRLCFRLHSDAEVCKKVNMKLLQRAGHMCAPPLLTSQSAVGSTAVSSRVQVGAPWTQGFRSRLHRSVQHPSTPATANESSLVLFWGHRKQKKKGNRNPG